MLTVTSGRTVLVSSTEDARGQLSLTDLPPAQTRQRARSARRTGPRVAAPRAAENPIAKVAVDIPLPHLDRPFDYAVTEAHSADALPGARVRVRFAGQLVDGFILERVASSEHNGRLSAIHAVVSPLPVLTPDVVALARAVADRYCGSLADVLRLAVPPRHAAVERQHVSTELAPPMSTSSDPITAELVSTDLLAEPTWSTRYRSGGALLTALLAGSSPRAAWCALPGVRDGAPAWVATAAEAVVATHSSGRGSIVVVPDHHDVELGAVALRRVGLDPVVLTANAGPRERYRQWLQVLVPHSDTPCVVIGTRAAVYAPVADLGLILVWDDGNDLHAEPRAPYPHTREVAALRALQSDAALIVGGYSRTAEVAAMVAGGFLRSVTASRPEVRASAPRIRASADAASDADPLARSARLPTSAWRAAREALTRGPVLVQVPRRGYVPSLACARCGERAICGACSGPLVIAGQREIASCLWCGESAPSWRCHTCGGERLRSQVVGARRTAEELGRAFPGVPILTSGGTSVRAEVSDDVALVVATPGAEPFAPSGYTAALLLDAWALLGRADLRAAEEALRRWMSAAALVRGAAEQGSVIVVADAGIPAVQSLVRWDPAAFADAELLDREHAGLPPARRIAVLEGAQADVDDLLARAVLPEETDRLGPIPLATARGGAPDAPPHVRVVLRSRPRSNALAAAIFAAQGERSVRKDRKDAAWVTVRIDPVGWG